MDIVTGTGIQKRTAYRVETDHLVLRCWSPEDAPLLRAALDINEDYLRPWIPFMKDEPRDLYQTAQWLRELRAAFDSGKFYRYAVFDRDESRLLGENMLLTRAGPGALEIGYWTHRDCAGRGVASQASCAMIRVAFEIEHVNRVEIQCSPLNMASASIPARLGFTHEATLKERVPELQGEAADLMVWSLFSDDYPNSPAATMPFRAIDCLGMEIINGE